MNAKQIIGWSVFGTIVIALISKKSTPGVKTLSQQDKILSLHPSLQPYAHALIEKGIATGIPLIITDAFRSVEQQNQDYAKGRTAPGSIVTYAKGGESFHNYGLAFDVVPVVNGKATYTYDWNKIGLLGKSVGLEWGGDFPHPDRPHFEKKFGNTITMLEQKYNTGKLQNGYVQLA